MIDYIICLVISVVLFLVLWLSLKDGVTGIRFGLIRRDKQPFWFCVATGLYAIGAIGFLTKGVVSMVYSLK
jgi:hypothetical protein